jgi:hypothetical protein
MNHTYASPLFSVTEDISALPAGTYLVRIGCGAVQYLEKLQKLP